VRCSRLLPDRHDGRCCWNGICVLVVCYCNIDFLRISWSQCAIMIQESLPVIRSVPIFSLYFHSSFAWEILCSTRIGSLGYRSTPDKGLMIVRVLVLMCSQNVRSAYILPRCAHCEFFRYLRFVYFWNARRRHVSRPTSVFTKYAGSSAFLGPSFAALRMYFYIMFVRLWLKFRLYFAYICDRSRCMRREVT